MAWKFLTISVFLISQEARAVPVPLDRAEELKNKVILQLSKIYLGARIELMQPIQWVQGAMPEILQDPLTVHEEAGRGEARFIISSNKGGEVSQGWVKFAAWVPAYVAAKRIHVGERLSAELFVEQEINVAVGQAREFRGVILSPEMDVSDLESRQTIVEGQFLVGSAVRKVPDIRKGDSIRIQLVSGSLTLSTSGVAQEPAYLNGRIRVMTSKTKRELVGKLVSGGFVEVKP